MSQLAVSLFGPCQVLLDGERITGFRTKKVQALLLCLATEPQQAFRREKLIRLFWPWMPESSARSNLRQILFHLRQDFPDFEHDGVTVPFFLANRNTIQLNPDADTAVDAVRFEALMSRVRNHDHVELLTCASCYRNLEKALSLYKGSFLADFYLDDSNEFEEWAESTRQEFRRKMLDALDILTTITTRRADYAEARAYAEQQLYIDNLHQSAYRQLMEILALSGQRAAALSLYDSYGNLLAEEWGMAPTAQTTRELDY